MRIEEIRFLLMGGAVKRFHTVPMLHENKLGQHQWGTAMFAWHLTRRFPSADLLMACLTHDMAEQRLGDMPGDTKNDLGLSHVFACQEKGILAEEGYRFTLTEEEEEILKAADRLDGMLCCIQERILGNKFVCKIYPKFRRLIGTNRIGSVLEETLQQLDKLWEEANAV